MRAGFLQSAHSRKGPLYPGLVGTLGWLSLEYEQYDGSFSYIHARTVYRLTEHFGIALGYQFLDMDLTVDRTRGDAGFDIQFNGPSLHLAYSF